MTKNSEYIYLQELIYIYKNLKKKTISYIQDDIEKKLEIKLEQE